MTTKLLLQYADIATLFLIVTILMVMWRKSLLSKFSMVAAYLFSVALHQSIAIPILFFRRFTPLSKDSAYRILFYSNVAFLVVGTVLMIAVIYGVFHIAMSPLKGLQRIGTIIFRWVAGVSALIGLVIASGPHIFTTGFASTVALTALFEQLQEGVSVLTICLLVFVCFAIRPLGLTYRSHVFGVTLGLGCMSTMQLVEAAWYSTAQAHYVYSPVYLALTTASFFAFAIWGGYFVMPEPERKMVLLPATSPFFHWNRISEALGNDPGHVAISMRPSMLGAGETKAIETINKYTRKRQAEEKAHSQSIQAQLGSDVDGIVAS